MNKAKEKKPNVIMIGKKKFVRGMKKPLRLPEYDFPVGFFAVEKPKKEDDK